MILVKTRWLSWTIRAVLYLPLVAIVLFVASAPFGIGHFNRIDRVQVEQRYRELVAAGKLEQPAEGFNAVTFTSQHGGRPFSVWFWRSDPKRAKFRYFAHPRRTPEGRAVWQFQDTSTKEYIY